MQKREDLQEIFADQAFYKDEYWHSPGGRAIREIVFGFNDGLVSTVGFMIGVASTFSDYRILLVTGLAEVMAGGVSMFFGAYLSTKNQREFFEHEIERERAEIEEMPEKERDEIRRIYAAKGFQGEELEMVVRHITSDRNIWLKCMMEEELGLIFESMGNPLKAACVTGLSFVLGGLLPLVPFFLLGSINALPHSIALSGMSLFVMGILKTSLTKKHWFQSGLESFLIGLAAGGAGLLFGYIATWVTGLKAPF